MEENKGTQERLEKVSWDLVDLEKKAGEYYQPEQGKQFTFMAASADLYKDSKWPDKNGKPKLKVAFKFKTLDNQTSTLIWETSSWTIIKKAKEVVIANKLDKCMFVVNQSKKGQNIEYTCMVLEGGILPS